MDADGNMYWVFPSDSEKLLIKSQDAWGYYLTGREVQQLLEALNPKGIEEGKLHTRLRQALSSKFLTPVHLDYGESIKPVENPIVYYSGMPSQMALESSLWFGKQRPHQPKLDQRKLTRR